MGVTQRCVPEKRCVRVGVTQRCVPEWMQSMCTEMHGDETETSLPHTQTLLILQLYSFSEIVIILVLLVSHIKKVLPRGKCLKEGRKDMKVGLHPFTNYCYCSQVLKKHIDLTTIGSGFVQV